MLDARFVSLHFEQVFLVKLWDYQVRNTRNFENERFLLSMEVPTVAIIMDKLQSTAVMFVRENVITKLAKLSLTNLKHSGCFVI